MKKDIHPAYSALTATCTCGNTLNLNSTAGKDMHIDVCSNCHPFYTGQQKMLDTGGRVDRFNKVAPKLFSKSATRLDSDDGGTLNTVAALVKLPVSTTLLKYRIARS